LHKDIVAAANYFIVRRNKNKNMGGNSFLHISQQSLDTMTKSDSKKEWRKERRKENTVMPSLRNRTKRLD
jgi:hypothetical protein